jgi:hypothetical protein
MMPPTSPQGGEVKSAHNRGVLGLWPARDDDVNFLSLLSEANRRRVLE